jgi:hypothetical protein
MISFLWTNQGLGWISFVLCAIIIGGINIAVLLTQKNKFSPKAIGFLLYRCGWSLSFAIYMLTIKLSAFDGFGLTIILIYYVLVCFDIFINVIDTELNLEIGPLFIPKIQSNNISIE